MVQRGKAADEFERPGPREARPVAQATSAYLAAWRWRRAVEKELRELELTFTQWLVLDATSDSIREHGDEVTQSAVAARIELDSMTTSQVMRTLAERGLVDRGGDMTGRAYRIILTRRGERLLRRANEVVERATFEICR